MKILITGGAGFVGSHLADKLIEQGHEITVIDDLSTGRYANVEHLEGNKNFRLIIDTVLNESLMEDLIRETDRVYHMASAVGVRLIMEQPVKTIERSSTAPTSLTFARVPKTRVDPQHVGSFRQRRESSLQRKATADRCDRQTPWSYAARNVGRISALAHFRKRGSRSSLCGCSTVGPHRPGNTGWSCRVSFRPR